jgi:phosphoribosylformylglycinamidine synthase
MKVGVVVFPGSNCDADTLKVFGQTMGLSVRRIWHKESSLGDCDLVVLPGGFSYGDYLRSGAIARFSPIMKEVVLHARAGGLVLGICNGFQILTEAGLLPGALLRNTSRLFVSKDIFVAPCSSLAPMTRDLKDRLCYRLPVAHGEGRYHLDREGLKALQDEDRILFRYCDDEGKVGGSANPNGSLDDIAGVCSANGRVMGLMPHPERAANPLLGLEDGLPLLQSLCGVMA